MMFMPISAGAILIRDRRHLDAAFQQSAPYLFHLRPDEDPIERHRQTNAAVQQAVRRSEDLGLTSALRPRLLRASAAEDGREHRASCIGWSRRQPISRPCMSPRRTSSASDICRGGSLRPVRKVDRLQDTLRARYNLSGKGWITATTLEGRRVLRVTMMNPHTEVLASGSSPRGLREEAGGRLPLREVQRGCEKGAGSGIRSRPFLSSRLHDRRMRPIGSRAARDLRSGPVDPPRAG
jgi:L-2,4-diaminobutyrate decarboxylase